VPAIDVAVVGGGCAGTYAAWRLATAPRPVLDRLFPDSTGAPTIHLYELTGRIGGRVQTQTIPGTSFPAELGAMRYTPNQVLLANLVRKLGLEAQARGFDLSPCMMYLRGSCLLPPSAGPYRLRGEERGLGAGELIMLAITRALTDLTMDEGSPPDLLQKLSDVNNRNTPGRADEFTTSEWAVIKRSAMLYGARLWELGFWNLLHHYLSTNAFLFVHDALGYESILSNWNAAEAIPWFIADFGASGYVALADGLQTVPQKLAYEFLISPDSKLFLEHQLEGIEPIETDGRRLLQLSFRRGLSEGDIVQVLAKHVILALPKVPLQIIGAPRAIGGTSEATNYRANLNQVTQHPLFKLFLLYERPWWTDSKALGCAYGRVVTDLPIRQIYYFGRNSDGTSAGAPWDGAQAVLMASYTDEHYVDFWKPLFQRGNPYYGCKENTGATSETLRFYGVPKAMLDKAHRQLLRMHPKLGIKSRLAIPDPCVGIAADWSRAPNYGGWHTWKVHAEPWVVRQNLCKPFAGLNVYVCGEAYSCEQGWIEGALRSTERVLQTIGLQPPDWVPQAPGEFEGYIEA